MSYELSCILIALFGLGKIDGNFKLAFCGLCFPVLILADSGKLDIIVLYRIVVKPLESFCRGMVVKIVEHIHNLAGL